MPLTLTFESAGGQRETVRVAGAGEGGARGACRPLTQLSPAASGRRRG
ncbi:MAG: hypothetical protein MZW92_55600 [Comamonadaceae bacterium]|nr:hypothetical protein [Comamonadaceae bacterium]